VTAPFGTFFAPGPTEVRPEILQAMARPMIRHRGTEYEALHQRVVAGLQGVFRTRRPVYLMTASATGFMEAAIRCAPEGPILSLVNGAFAERFAKIAQRCDRRTRILTVPWGETPALDLVEQLLSEDSFAAVTVVHSETSSGTLTDVRAVTELAHRYGAMCLVDAVTSIAGVPFETDAWGVDLVLTGSQKALALPPGMAFGVASEAYILQASATHGRGRYLDLVEYEEAALRSGTPTTPALPILFAADAQLADIAVEGIDARWARHAAMLARAERWVEECRADGIEVAHLPRAGERSPTVSAFRLPEGRRASDVVSRVAAAGYLIAGGYGPLRETTIRIGHMGDHTEAGLTRCLAAVRVVLAS
jgi:aspartate aminotransferase-like enzyme